MKTHQKEFRLSTQHLFVPVWRGILVGISAGIVVSLFRLLIGIFTEWTLNAYTRVTSQPIYLLGILIVSLVLISLVGLLVKSDSDIKGSGIPHVEGELMGRLQVSWWSVLWKKFIGGSFAISMGLMLGREGPSIQLGAVTAKGLSEYLGLTPKEKRVLIASGAAAGLSAAFNAPIAGLLFIIEEVYHHFSRMVWITALVASLVANIISLNIFGLTPVLHMPEGFEALRLSQYLLLLPMGIFLGFLGYGYEWTVLRVGKVYGFLGNLLKLPVPFYGILAVLLTVPIGYFFPELLGGGHHLILHLPDSGFTLGIALLFLVIRFVWSMIAYGSGLPGGIFLPLLALGSLSGFIFGLLAEAMGLAQTSQLTIFIILGMAGYFGAVSKAPLTAMILVTEMVGDLSQLMTIGLVVLVAYLTMDLLGGEPVYEAMLAKMVPVSHLENSEPTMIELPVTEKLVGRRVSDLKLPNDVLITTQVSHGNSEVVTGRTILQAGATIYLVVNESDIHLVNQVLFH
ncbi:MULTISPECIES: ClC family H(+)/Cl(-) exchange transporter [Streptococcus]|uniref:Chloride channel protein n=1 Tax=Streptococcus caledonicus TaxID=2614158 RepID=A0ABW0UGH7_9STRE|nr:ClC family H(+)/Cl(-) exchange transporter [Streptococcus sp. S784/96/1]